MEIAFTGTPVTDIERARAFYEGVLGLKPTMEADGGLWVEYDIGNGVFGIAVSARFGSRRRTAHASRLKWTTSTSRFHDCNPRA